MKKNLFLATTAIPDFWDTSKDVLFLGEWCKPHLLKSVWEKLNFTVLSVDTKHTQQEYDYTLQVYESLLPQIVNWLNQIHHKNYSLKYWKIIIGPFLLWYIQVLYDRYSYLRMAFSAYPVLDTVGLSDQAYFTPIDTNEFYQLATENDAWNLQLFTQLLHLMSVKPIYYKYYDWRTEKTQRQKQSTQSHKYKKTTQFKMRLLKIVSKIRGSKAIGIYFCGMNKKNLYRLLLKSRFRIFPVVKFSFKQNISQTKVDLNIRDTITQLIGEDTFSKMVLTTLKFNMPINFIEGYQAAVEQSNESFPYEFNTIVAVGWNPDDSLKFWGAKKVEEGGKIIDIQHGGGYGTHQYSTREWLERDNCDAFISWGWSGDKIIAAPSILACEKNLKNKTNNALILWVANEIPRYLLSMEKSLHSLEHSYLNTQVRFANHLSDALRKKLTMRIRPDSDKMNELKSAIPDLNIFIPNDKHCFFEQLSTTKIFISDNLQTTFLYALSFNVPTILFTDGELKHINSSAMIYFKKLHECGIYHDSPEAAAQKLTEINENPNRWWQTPMVQKARDEFCHQFVRTTPNWLSEWNRLLLAMEHHA
jgi:putative transferase (TIGR04331 family)